MRLLLWASRLKILPTAVLAFLTLFYGLTELYAQTVHYTFVYGCVVDEEGLGIPDVLIQASSSDGSLREVSYTEGDGSFGILLERGQSYMLTFSKPGYVKATRSITAREFDMNIGNVTLRRAVRFSSAILRLTA